MRLIRLEMQAFGPYAERQIIDFSALSGIPLYLICGDTGAGKTTIFDAITYALYGSTSSKRRTAEDLRSKYASAQLPTEVLLTLSHRNHQYSVLRRPKQILPKLRGEGMREINHTVEMTLHDGRQLTSIEGVKATVEELLGLTQEQFIQIVMIAQGDFARVLFAEPASRTAILRKIFRTDFYNTVQQRIEMDWRAAKQASEQADLIYRTDEATISVPEDHPLAAELLLSKTHQLLPADSLQLLEELNRQDQKLEASYRKQKAVLSAESENIRKALQEAKRREEARNKLNEIQNSLINIRQEKERADLNLIIAQKRQPEIQDNRNLASALTERLPRYAEAEETDRSLRKNSELSASARKEIEAKESDLQDTDTKLNKLREELASLADSAEQMRQAERTLTALELRYNQAVDADEKVKELIRLQDRLSTEQRLALKAENEWLEANNHSTEVTTLYLHAQAGIMASQLTEGKPCPVCGATHHPQLAICPDNAPDENEEKRCRAEADKKRRAYETAARSAGALKAQVESVQAECSKRVSLCFEETLEDPEIAIETLLKNLEIEIAKAKASLQQAEKRSERERKLRESIGRGEERFRRMEKEIAEARTLLAQYETAASHDRALLEKLTQELNPPTKAEAEALIKRYQQTAAAVENEIKSALEKANASAILLAQKEGEKSQQKQLLQTMPEQDVTSISARSVELQDEITRTEQAIEEVITRLGHNTALLERMEREKADMERAKERYVMLDQLYNTAAGKHLRRKIDLETFVQQQAFDRVLYRANQRLAVMTDRQYALTRTDASLTLSVRDAWNGSVRSVSTLSGGETFKASLALALGLSDEIQATTGGAQIDSLFIDEGFGSLDEESLNGAIAVLKSLSDGRRQVAIISHVADLQRRIDQKIVVRKDPITQQSTATIVDGRVIG